MNFLNVLLPFVVTLSIHTMIRMNEIWEVFLMNPNRTCQHIVS